MLDSQPNRDMCLRQLMRMGGLPNFPTTEEAVGELVATMLEYCRDVDHAEETATGLSRALQFAPRPIDIIDQAALIHAVSLEFPYCALCNTSGIAPALKVVEIRGERYEFSGPCSCPKGRHQAAEVAKREADAKAKRDKAAQKRVDKYMASVVDYKMAAGGE